MCGRIAAGGNRFHGDAVVSAKIPYGNSLRGAAFAGGDGDNFPFHGLELIPKSCNLHRLAEPGMDRRDGDDQVDVILQAAIHDGLKMIE